MTEVLKNKVWNFMLYLYDDMNMGRNKMLAQTTNAPIFEGDEGLYLLYKCTKGSSDL